MSKKKTEKRCPFVVGKGEAMSKRRGTFDEAIKACWEFMDDKYRETYCDAVSGAKGRELRVAIAAPKACEKAEIIEPSGEKPLLYADVAIARAILRFVDVSMSDYSTCSCGYEFIRDDLKAAIAALDALEKKA